MNIRIGASWQTLFADLSIILFMITAATLSHSGEEAVSKPRLAAAMPAAAPVALYRAGEGSPSLAQWLAAQSPDSRQRLSLVVTYRSGGQEAALERAGALLRQAGAHGANARVVIEPGAEEATASLAFDAALARSLPVRQDNKETTS